MIDAYTVGNYCVYFEVGPRDAISVERRVNAGPAEVKVADKAEWLLHTRTSSNTTKILPQISLPFLFPCELAGRLNNKQTTMSLPVVASLGDCTDLYKTVIPYLPQLYDLPQQFFQSINNVQALKVLYISTNPLISALAFSLFLMPVFLIISEVNKNYSQVDRCWSILPTIYNAHFVLYAHAAGLPTKRLDTLLLFSGLWSVRHCIAEL